MFFVIDGEIHYPAASGFDLPGITRDSILTLAAVLGYKVSEKRLTMTSDGSAAEARCRKRWHWHGAVVSPVRALL
jgi:branched-chain amino acid aminotransferase